MVTALVAQCTLPADNFQIPMTVPEETGPYPVLPSVADAIKCTVADITELKGLCQYN